MQDPETAGTSAGSLGPGRKRPGKAPREARQKAVSPVEAFYYWPGYILILKRLTGLQYNKARTGPRFFPPHPYNPLSPAGSFLLLISALTGFHN